MKVGEREEVGHTGDVSNQEDTAATRNHHAAVGVRVKSQEMSLCARKRVREDASKYR